MLTRDELKALATITLEAEQDDLPVRGNAMASGDDAADKEVEDKILSDLEWNVWAWAQVDVKAAWKGLEGHGYLGACSYESEEDFKRDGYYEDLIDQAMDDLYEQYTAIVNATAAAAKG